MWQQHICYIWFCPFWKHECIIFGKSGVQRYQVIFILLYRCPIPLTHTVFILSLPLIIFKYKYLGTNSGIFGKFPMRGFPLCIPIICVTPICCDKYELSNEPRIRIKHYKSWNCKFAYVRSLLFSRHRTPTKLIALCPNERKIGCDVNNVKRNMHIGNYTFPFDKEILLSATISNSNYRLQFIRM